MAFTVMVDGATILTSVAISLLKQLGQLVLAALRLSTAVLRWESAVVILTDMSLICTWACWLTAQRQHVT